MNQGHTHSRFAEIHFPLLYHEWNATGLILSKIGCLKKTQQIVNKGQSCLPNFKYTTQICQFITITNLKSNNWPVLLNSDEKQKKSLVALTDT
jgi:hypothetical protein